jgi:alginate O-acetyltransferase complex protein AlgI
VWLVLAVALNLLILGYFKYANFFIDNTNYLLHALSRSEVRALNVALPIGISFFTFTQIAFLVDCYQGKVRERNFVHYLLFVSYFPHLISGPVLHHSQMMPQFRRPETYRLRPDYIFTGLFNVAAGLAKKALLADEFSQYATPIFDAARSGHSLTYVAAWTGVLAYTLQIYFDFSGYTDMAIGLSKLLGINLPLNFDAPYKSVSIIEFWRRWHITLSNFLRDYLYIPLGGNRRGEARRYGNLFLTMLLGGLWHGANWTFVVWGGLHGTYLLINHGWRAVATSLPVRGKSWSALGRAGGGAITFMAVLVAWVFFRATTFAGAAQILSAMTRVEPIHCAAGCFAAIYGDIPVPPTSLGYLSA